MHTAPAGSTPVRSLRQGVLEAEPAGQNCGRQGLLRGSSVHLSGRQRKAEAAALANGRHSKSKSGHGCMLLRQALPCPEFRAGRLQADPAGWDCGRPCRLQGDHPGINPGGSGTTGPGQHFFGMQAPAAGEGSSGAGSGGLQRVAVPGAAVVKPAFLLTVNGLQRRQFREQLWRRYRLSAAPGNCSAVQAATAYVILEAGSSVSSGVCLSTGGSSVTVAGVVSSPQGTVHAGCSLSLAKLSRSRAACWYCPASGWGRGAGGSMPG